MAIYDGLAQPLSYTVLPTVYPACWPTRLIERYSLTQTDHVGEAMRIIINNQVDILINMTGHPKL